MTHRFRFAPTPSRALHAGSALAAIYGWAACRAAAGHFILRIEDIDRVRCLPEHEATLLDDLAWLGLDWDEPPTRQSERTHLYDEALVQLAQATYICRCSRADIRQAQSAPHLGLDGEPAEVPYPGTCRHAGLTLSDLPGPGGLRFDVDRLGEGAIVDWHDALLGPQREDVRTTSGDILLGRPGQPTYQLAVVVDDHLMGVTDVVRGRDLLGSTARQLLLHRALAANAIGAIAPRFHHHPLIVDEANRKLSKRDADQSLRSLRAAGVDAHALGATLGRAIGLFDASVLRATPADWADALDHAWAHDHGGALHDGRMTLPVAHSETPA